MGEKLVVGPINRGLRNDRKAFVIDNDSFPTLVNAYQWRGRIKRKRGTSFLARLERYFNSTIASYNPGSTTITLGNDGGGNGTGNLLTGFTALESTATLALDSITITDSTSSDVYADNGLGILTGSPTGSGTINYASGAFVIAGAAGHTVTATFSYYPGLPVMGLEDFVSVLTQYPGTLGFDTTYAYNFLTSAPYDTYSVSFYKNPPTATYAGYTQKSVVTPTTWNGQNYQQFWTVNYQGALWATNGVTDPFSTTNIGMQFKRVTNVTIVSAGPPGTATLTIAAHGLVVGDFLYLNEFNSSVVTGINYQTVYVTAVVDANDVTVEFQNGTLAGSGGATATGIAQYLTSRANDTLDCIRWYDGDPTNGSIVSPGLTGHLGWVNFTPPLSQGNYSIADLPPAQYYLVGAKLIFPFKDRLLFFGPVVQTSSANSQVYLKDTIIYSQNGTPYYTSSFTDTSLIYPLNPTNGYTGILVPVNQTATAPAYFEDQTGFGGYITAGNDQAITSLGLNEDVLIVMFSRSMTRLVYSGNDILPFNFYAINSEWGTSATFSAITMDQGVVSLGNRGFISTGQTNSSRIDLEIPDEVFDIGLQNNGAQRVCSQRDYINEWIYFTYCPDDQDDESITSDIYPMQTLQWNYRDNSWSIFLESYTTYGTFRRLGGFTWATVGNYFPTWIEWNEPWNAGVSSQLQPEVIAGNSQGYVVFRDQGTAEAKANFIQNISGNLVTSPGHSLRANDFIIITDCQGTVSSYVNQKIFQVIFDTRDAFYIVPPLPSGLTYTGGGQFIKIYNPLIQTKQFPTAWGNARKTRLGPQQYLLTTTANSQITLLIYLSQEMNLAYNALNFPYPSGIVPAYSPNNALIYSATLYTCPESANLGLTPANTNLNLLTAVNQQQTWHRMNTSLIGDTVQIGFSLSSQQLQSLNPVGNPFTITGATQAYPCVLTASGQPNTNQLVFITGVEGMTQLNNNYYNIIASTGTTITIDVNATGFTAYAMGGTAQVVAPQNQFAEIELHGFILDVQPSQLLA